MPLTLMYWSARRWVTAWKVAIGRPNCSRSLVYSAVIASAGLADADLGGAQSDQVPVHHPVDGIGPTERLDRRGREVDLVQGLQTGTDRSPAGDAVGVAVDQIQTGCALVVLGDHDHLMGVVGVLDHDLGAAQVPVGDAGPW